MMMMAKILKMQMVMMVNTEDVKDDHGNIVDDAKTF